MSSNKNIGLALSGGGVRAMAFHLGLLKFLADCNEFQNIKHISSVSGGTLIVGLLYGLNGNKWPVREEFLKIYPKIVHCLSHNALIELKDIPYFLLNLHLSLFNRRKLLSKQIKRKWKIDSPFKEIDERICWDVCGTTKETGNRFMIKKKLMGDHKIGYTGNNNLKLQDIMSISASVPFIIGSYRLNLRDYYWERYSKKDEPLNLKKITLFDGGVYDNLGLESLYDISTGEIKEKTGADFIIVSDSGKPLGYKSLLRTSDIMMDNINKLRMRNFMEFVTKKKKGIFVKLGRNMKPRANSNLPAPLADHEIAIARNYGTSLRRIPQDQLAVLIKHGYNLCETYMKMVS